jgi:hypothetical protein
MAATDPTPPPTPGADPTGLPPSPPRAPTTATVWQVCGAVFWSFFGVRKGRAMARDAVTIRPLHIVVVGVLAGVAFVATLLIVVRLVLRAAGV